MGKEIGNSLLILSSDPELLKTCAVCDYKQQYPYFQIHKRIFTKNKIDVLITI